MRLRNLLLAWCGLMCTLAPAEAQELRLGLGQELVGETNVFKTSVDPQADATYRIRPTINLSQPESNLNYEFLYHPSYQTYVQADGLNGWDHVARGRASYQFQARDRLRFRGEYLDFRTIRADTQLDINDVPFVVRNADGRSRRALAELALDHSFAQRVQGTIGLRYDNSSFTESNFSSNQAVGALAQLTYAFRERFTAGLGVDTRYRDFEETEFSPGSNSTIVNTNVIAQVDVTPTLEFRFTGGPAGLFTRQDLPEPREVSRFIAGGTLAGRNWGDPSTPGTCGTINGLPALRRCQPIDPSGLGLMLLDTTVVGLVPGDTLFGRSTSALTYFISVTLRKRFPRGSAAISFSRNEDGGAGLSTLSILNQASLRVVYQLSDPWRFTLAAVYLSREAVSQLPSTEVLAVPSGIPSPASPGDEYAQAGGLFSNPVPVATEQTTFFLEANARRQLGQRTYLELRARYFRQTASRTNRLTTEFDNFAGSVVFVYEFDPIKL